MSKISFRLTFITTSVFDAKGRTIGFRVVCVPGKVSRADAPKALEVYPAPEGTVETISKVVTVRRLAEVDDSVVAEMCHDVTGDTLGVTESSVFVSGVREKEDNADE